MNYEHYGGSGSLPLRRRGANDAASQKFNGHQASNKFEGIGTFNPDDNRRGRMSSDLERRFNNRLKTVAAQHGNGAGDALDRVGDLEIKSKELEAELIQLSQELAEQDQKWAEVEEQFSNLNRGVVELMKDQTTSQNSSDMSQVTSRMQSVERSLGRLDNMMTLFQSQDQSKILAARVDELQKLSASLKMELELKIVEEIESMQVSLENVEERARVLEDDCLSAPCGEHGQCTDLIRDFKCTCDLGWHGRLCDQVSVSEMTNGKHLLPA